MSKMFFMFVAAIAFAAVPAFGEVDGWDSSYENQHTNTIEIGGFRFSQMGGIEGSSYLLTTIPSSLINYTNDHNGITNDIRILKEREDLSFSTTKDYNAGDCVVFDGGIWVRKDGISYHAGLFDPSDWWRFLSQNDIKTDSYYGMTDNDGVASAKETFNTLKLKADKKKVTVTKSFGVVPDSEYYTISADIAGDIYSLDSILSTNGVVVGHLYGATGTVNYNDFGFKVVHTNGDVIVSSISDDNLVYESISHSELLANISEDSDKFGGKTPSQFSDSILTTVTNYVNDCLGGYVPLTNNNQRVVEFSGSGDNKGIIVGNSTTNLVFSGKQIVAASPMVFRSGVTFNSSGTANANITFRNPSNIVFSDLASATLANLLVYPKTPSEELWDVGIGGAVVEHEAKNNIRYIITLNGGVHFVKMSDVCEMFIHNGIADSVISIDLNNGNYANLIMLNVSGTLSRYYGSSVDFLPQDGSSYRIRVEKIASSMYLATVEEFN